MMAPISLPSKKTRSDELDHRHIKKDLNRLLKEKLVWREELKKKMATRAANYIYLYDDYLKDKEYKQILFNIERRLSDFEIAGKVIRLTNFSNPRVIIDDELRHGVGTVVVVGNDDTLARVFFRAADLDVAFGFLPVGQKKNTLADFLGIPLNEKSCDVLAARKIERIDYGIVNQKYFFVGNVCVPAAVLKFACDDKFFVSIPNEKIEAAVTNLLPPPFTVGKFRARPQDGRMEFYLRASNKGLVNYLKGGSKTTAPSVFPFKKLFLKSDKPTAVVIDGHPLQESSLVFEISKKKLALVVGKGRKF